MTKHGFYSSQWLPGSSLTEGWEITVWPSSQPHFADSITEAREYSNLFSKPKPGTPDQRDFSWRARSKADFLPWQLGCSMSNSRTIILRGDLPSNPASHSRAFYVESTIFHFYNHRSSPRPTERFGQGRPANSLQSWDKTTPSLPTSHSQLSGMHTCSHSRTQALGSSAGLVSTGQAAQLQSILLGTRAFLLQMTLGLFCDLLGLCPQLHQAGSLNEMAPQSLKWFNKTYSDCNAQFIVANYCPSVGKNDLQSAILLSASWF